MTTKANFLLFLFSPLNQRLNLFHIGVFVLVDRWVEPKVDSTKIPFVSLNCSFFDRNVVEVKKTSSFPKQMDINLWCKTQAALEHGLCWQNLLFLLFEQWIKEKLCLLKPDWIICKFICEFVLINYFKYLNLFLQWRTKMKCVFVFKCPSK